MPEKRRVYLDSCCFIEMVKHEVGKRIETSRQADVWFLKKILEAARDGEVDTFTSTLSIAECSHGGEGDVSEPVKSHFDRLLMSGQYVTLVQATPFIGQDARDLRWKKGIALKGPDALHVASAMAMKCEELLTCNGRLERLRQRVGNTPLEGMTICQAQDTNCLPAKYRQLGLQEGQNSH